MIPRRSSYRPSIQATCIRHFEKRFDLRGFKKEKLKEFRRDVIYPLIASFAKQTSAEYPHHHLVKETQTQLQNSVIHSMEEIMRRVPGSQKGIMYYNRFFEEMKDKMDGDIFYPIPERRNFVSSNPFFKLSTKNHFLFIGKTGPSAAECVQAFLKGPIFADCGTAVEAVYFQAILNLLGKQKFDSLFNSRQNKLMIGPYVSYASLPVNYSIDNFVELIDPRLQDPVNLSELKIGDHICIKGVDGYSIKHPLGNWANLHCVVLGFNKAREPLFKGLGIDSLMTISEITKELIDSYNEPQTDEDKNKAKECHQKLDVKQHVSFELGVSLGAGTALNFTACRISPYILSILRQASASENLHEIAFQAKAHVLAHQCHLLEKLT